MEKLVSKVKDKIVTAGCRLSLKKRDILAKDRGEAGLIVAIALIAIAIALLVIFKDTIFASVKTAMSNAKLNLDDIFNMN